MSSFHEEEVLGKAYDSRLMRRLLGYLRPYKLWVLGALLALMGDALLQLTQPYLMKVAIDRYIAQGDLAGLRATSRDSISWCLPGPSPSSTPRPTSCR